ncbi:hypothetical protein [Streptomyces sp. HO565]|uniref:hypothetical protein n=1 Tax=Streptomyces sp. HO565 TaxID=2857489 RepID=UPI0034DBE705
MRSDEDHCPIGAARPPVADGPPYAMGSPPPPPRERSRAWGSALCREPTEHPESYQVTLCPRCEWQEARRTACSG